MSDQSLSSTGVDAVRDLCQPFLDALPITGASVTVINSSGAQMTLCSSDATAARIDELQFELGEGPQLSATRSGNMVLIPDVDAHPHDDWPVFGMAVRGLRIGAIFSVPIRMGAVNVGAATLYRDTSGSLSMDRQISALAIASAVANPAVQQAMLSADADTLDDPATETTLRREVHQATGMVLVQLDTTATIAYSRLQAYAFACGRTLQSVAHDVVTHELDFENMDL